MTQKNNAHFFIQYLFQPRTIFIINRILWAILGLSFAFTQPTQSQTSDILRLGFRQDFNNYLWQTKFSYMTPVEKKYQLFISESYQANLLETSQQTDKWKDDHNFLLDYQYRFKSWLQSGLLFESTIFSDRQSGFINNYDTHSLSFGLISYPKSFIQLKSYLGIKSDERYDRRDNGLHYQVNSSSSTFRLFDYNNQFQINLHGDEFKERKDQDFLLQYKIYRQFYKNTVDSLSYQIGYSKRIYYISQDGNLESRTETDNKFENYLNYQISYRLTWNLLTQIFNRTGSVDQIIDKNPTGTRERNDTGMNWESYLSWKFDRLISSIGWTYTNNSQEFQTSKSILPSPSIGSIGIPDNKSKTISIHATSSILLSKKDSLSTRFLISRFQYDTPDSNNFDDRDEMRTTAILGYTHFFSPSLQMGIEAKVNLHHLVYIFNERSVNNNWNRIFQLSNSIKFRPSHNFRWYQYADVFANYTSYDFEEIQSQVRSFVYRKFSLTDSLAIGSPYHFQFNLFHRLEFEENGRLFWNDFSEQQLMNRQNHYLTIGFQFPLIGNLFIYNGISAYLRREWRYKPSILGKMIREKWGDFISFGPQIKLFLLNRQKNNAFVSIGRFRVEPPNAPVYFINQIDLNAFWNF